MPEAQALIIEPEQELKFKGPFTAATTSLLKLTNPTDKRICFKIKTTAPKRYCVRPNAGILEPGLHLSIAVVFQPCELEPTANKHKFMVQALYIPDGDVNLDEIWKNVDQAKLMDTKLRCAFEIPSENQNDLSAAQEANRSRSDPDHRRVEHITSSSDDNRGVDTGLSQEATQLRNENNRLKEEILRLKNKIKSREGEYTTAVGMGNAAAPAQNMLYVVLAILIALASLCIGKFVL